MSLTGIPEPRSSRSIVCSRADVGVGVEALVAAAATVGPAAPWLTDPDRADVAVAPAEASKIPTKAMDTAPIRTLRIMGDPGEGTRTFPGR
jgi:hypothetical protein